MKPYGLMFKIAASYYCGNSAVQDDKKRLYETLRRMSAHQYRIGGYFSYNTYTSLKEPVDQYLYEYHSPNPAKVLTDRLREQEFPLGENDYGGVYAALRSLSTIAQGSELAFRIHMETTPDRQDRAHYPVILQNLDKLERAVDDMADVTKEDITPDHYFRYGVTSRSYHIEHAHIHMLK